ASPWSNSRTERATPRAGPGRRAPRPLPEPAPLVFPEAAPAQKGALLSPGAPPQPPQPEALPDPLPADIEAALHGPALPLDEAAAAAEPEAGADRAGTVEGRDAPDLSILEAAADPNPKAHDAHVFFGAPTANGLAAREPWAAGERPTLTRPRRPADSDIKLSALAPANVDPKADTGVTVAGKGEVTGEGRRPKSPAERLGLDGKARAKAEKCLANAIYF